MFRKYRGTKIYDCAEWVSGPIRNNMHSWCMCFVFMCISMCYRVCACMRACICMCVCVCVFTLQAMWLSCMTQSVVLWQWPCILVVRVRNEMRRARQQRKRDLQSTEAKGSEKQREENNWLQLCCCWGTTIRQKEKKSVWMEHQLVSAASKSETKCFLFIKALPLLFSLCES